MKQVYAAGPLAGGPAPTAASAGLRPDDVEAVLRHARPAAGTRLALLDSPAGRLLVHVVPGDERFVAHALVGVPTSADAQSAIQTWDSPQWQRHAPDPGTALPDLPYLPVADKLDDAGLRAWLATPARRDLVEFVLAALLATPSTTRVVVAAPAADVAQVVYAVTRALPNGLLDAFTFSTAEADPLAVTVRLAGADPNRPLGDALFAGGFAGFDPDAGRKTDLPDVPFAPFAVGAIAAGEFAKLDDLKALWQRLGLTDPGQFDLVYRLGRGAGVLTREEAAEAVRQPALAAWLAARADAVNQLLDWAVDDRQFATDSFPRVVQALRQRPEVLTKLGQTARDRGVQALKAGDRERAGNALEVVLPTVAPAKAGQVWGDLLGSFADPDVLPWEMRGYLLPKFARFRQQQGQAGVDPALQRWLSVPPERLGELLRLDLPRPYQLAAGRACLLRDGEPTDDLARTLGAVPSLALTLLKPEASDETRAAGLFEKLLKVQPEHPWLEDVVGAGDDFPAAARNRFVETALLAGPVDADRLVRTRGPRLLELLAGQPALDKLATQLLASPPDDLLIAAPVLDFLHKFKADPAASPTTVARVMAVETARDFVRSPGFAPDRLTAVADALRVSPPVLPASAKGAVFGAVAGELARRADADEFQTDLEATLLHLGGVLASDPADLCENLLRDLRTRTDLTRRPGPTAAFLAVALGAAQSPELDGKLDGLDGPAFALGADAARRGGTRLLDEIDRRAAGWPKPARAQWAFLRAAVQPPGLKRYVRDLEFFVLGGCAATIVWYAYTQLGR